MTDTQEWVMVPVEASREQLRESSYRRAIAARPPIPAAVLDQMVERGARAIGYHFAALVSGNNMPHMSGDPRARISPAKRRQFDDCANEAARACILAALGDA